MTTSNGSARPRRARAHNGVRRGTATGGAAAVLAYGAALNRLVPSNARIPANLVAAGTAVATMHASGVTWRELGLAPSDAARGARIGFAVAAPIIAGTAVLATLPATARHFDDPRVRDAPHPVFETVLRIPVGTALCEELIFRSALLALFDRRQSPLVASAASAAVFGLWHVFPALDALAADADAGTRASTPARTAGFVAGTVAATTAAGLAFALLRRMSGSVVAPVVAHSALNVSAFMAVRLNDRRTRSHNRP